ncbi:molybdopterin-dependent oxidoreductase [soil metagenome]
MTVEITRRSFLAGISAATAGLALGVQLADASNKGRFVPNAFIQIGNDGIVVITCHRSEMGQGIRSSLPVLIADELGADPANIVVAQGDGDQKYGDQNTDGSTSIRNFFDAMRQAGAVARTMLITAAAQRWRVAPESLTTANDAVHDHARKRSLPFAEVAPAAGLLPVPKAVKLRPISELTHLGTELPLRDGPAYVTGTAQFGADIRLPGMLVAVIARPPALFGKVAKLDASAAKAIAGVRQIVELPAPSAPADSKPLGGIAVLADHTWGAMRGRAKLAIEWDSGPNGHYDSDDYQKVLLAAVRQPGLVQRSIGDASAGIANAARVIEAEYLVPHLVHAPMEPPVALAKVEGERAEIWTCTQDPQGAREEVAKALGVPEANVTIHVTFLGGGFGRKSIPDFAIEAALLSRAAKAPVRVQWTREDEIRHAYYHTVSAQQLSAGLDDKGNVIAWRHRIAYPSIGATFNASTVHPSAGELGQGVLDLPLAIPNVRVATGSAPAHIRIGWLRSVCNIQQAFAVQSFINELAHATQRDPRDMLMAVLGPARTLTPADQGLAKLGNYGAALDKHPIDVARFHRVIERVTKSASWDTARSSGRALGLAVHRSFLSYVAVVAEVSRGPRGELRVDEAWIAADAGTIVNLDRVKAQLEGAFVFGMSLALHGAITVKNGGVVQRNFRDYPIVRITEAPRSIHLDVVPSSGPPGGIGEPGVPPVAPAIMNAWFALTGNRVRELPLVRARLPV